MMPSISRNTRYRLGIAILLAMGLLAAIASTGCIVHDRPLKTDLAPDVQVPETTAVMLFIDGVGNEVFDARLAAGDLPNIQRYIIDRGLRFRRTVTCIPSITYAVTASFLTGVSPGYHGIIGNRWFDPYSMRYQAYAHIKTYRTAQNDFIAPTIFELLHDQYTVSIQVATRRGVTREIDNWATSGINWFFGQYTNVDKLTAMRFDLIAEQANRTGRWPRFVLAYFPACDETAHRRGVNSPEYALAIRNVDEQIGRICRGLERAGVLDRTLLILATDHGQAPMRDGDGMVNVPAYLADHFGMRVTAKRLDSDDYMKRFDFYDRFDVVAVPDAPRLLGLHLRKAQGQWYDRAADVRPLPIATRAADITAQELAEDLASKPYARFVAMRAGENTVQLIGRTGKALIHANGPADSQSFASSQPSVSHPSISAQLTGATDILYTYQILQGSDPLDLGLPELSSQSPEPSLTLSGSQWLARTIDSPNPGVVSQIATYFTSSRAGDIVVFAEPGYGFGPDRSGHGSTSSQEMRVPLVFAGPGVKPGTTDEPARVQSVMPTILTALGYGDRLNVRIPLDGPVLKLR